MSPCEHAASSAKHPRDLTPEETDLFCFKSQVSAPLSKKAMGQASLSVPLHFVIVCRWQNKFIERGFDREGKLMRVLLCFFTLTNDLRSLEREYSYFSNCFTYSIQVLIPCFPWNTMDD